MKGMNHYEHRYLKDFKRGRPTVDFEANINAYDAGINPREIVVDKSGRMAGSNRF